MRKKKKRLKGFKFRTFIDFFQMTLLNDKYIKKKVVLKGQTLGRCSVTWNNDRKVQKKINGPENGVVSHQGGVSLWWSLIRWSLTRVVFHHSGLSSGWCFIMVVSH